MTGSGLLWSSIFSVFANTSAGSSTHGHICCFWGLPLPQLCPEVPCLLLPACARGWLISLAASERVSALLTAYCMGMSANMITFGDPAMSSGFLDQGRKTSRVMMDKVCQPSLGTTVPTVSTSNWYKPMGF